MQRCEIWSDFQLRNRAIEKIKLLVGSTIDNQYIPPDKPLDNQGFLIHFGG